MPSYRTHKNIGFFVSILLGTLLLVLANKNILRWEFFLAIPTILFYSNFPDLDHYKGRLRKFVFTSIFYFMILSVFVAVFIDPLVMFLILILFGMFGLFVIKLKHRRYLHTYSAMLWFSLPLLLVNMYLFCIAVLCSFSHIFVDRVTSKIKAGWRKFCTNSLICRVFKIGVYNSKR